MSEMQDKSDAQLLRAYAESGQETAFREIVTRHADLVYSAALRQVNSPDLARDLAQGVFTDLARKGRPLAQKLTDGSSLVGWLYRSTRFAALKHLRDDRRRLTHERQAMEQLIINSETAPDWEQVRPVLDETMADLNDEDREALLLRYFKNCDFQTVGQALGVSDAAAQKRVSRALDKLRELMSRRGITTSAAALSIVLSANAVQAAPVGLAATLSTAAIGGTTLTTAAATATKAIAMTTLQKSLFVAVIVASATAPLLIHSHARSRLREQEQALNWQAERLGSLRIENEGLSNRLLQTKGDQAVPDDEFRELLRLRGQAGLLRNEIRSLAQSKSSVSVTREAKLAAMASYYSAQVRQLKGLFEANPGDSIPELQFLTEEDWLSSSGLLDTEEDIRSSLSNMRGHAWSKFATATLVPAMQQYANEHDQQSPTALSQLKPYFKSPIDDTILDRWVILPASSLAKELQTGDAWLLTQKSPVDKQMDQRLAFGLKATRLGNRGANHW